MRKDRRSITDDDIQWALEKTGLVNFVKEQPQGLRTMMPMKEPPACETIDDYRYKHFPLARGNTLYQAKTSSMDMTPIETTIMMPQQRLGRRSNQGNLIQK